MRVIQFHQWEEVLQRTRLPERQKQSWTITIRWFICFCQRGRSPVTAQTARDFIAWAQKQKRAEPWEVERWKEAIRWFFKEAQRPCPAAGNPHHHARVARASKPTAEPEDDRPGSPGNNVHWRTAFLTVLRRRKYSYRLVWMTCGGWVKRRIDLCSRRSFNRRWDRINADPRRRGGREVCHPENPDILSDSVLCDLCALCGQSIFVQGGEF